MTGLNVGHADFNILQERIELDITQHWLLAALWTLYCSLHSLLAAPWWKRRVNRWMGEGYRYYRPIYSVFAAISLIAVLIYQFSIHSVEMVVIPFWLKLLTLPIAVIGLMFMWKSIRKYFFYLSGIDVIVNKPVTSRLETGGLHKLVRHPLYFGTLTVIWCLFVWMPTFANMIACLMISLYTMIGIRIEERKLLVEFGEEYHIYQQQVSMIFPRFRKRILKNDTFAND